MDNADGVRCMLMRGGSSKGAYFVADDLPEDPAERDQLLLELLGSPDPRQIDGLGGAHPLTSKVAVVSASSTPGIDLEYLFLQVAVGEPLVSDSQNCGNLLAGVGPFGIERELVTRAPSGGTDSREVTIHMVNTDSVAVATVPVRDGRPVYRGATAISGVPGTAAPIRLDFADVAGGSCGSLLPTGRAVDEICGVPCTLIDNGMPVVVMAIDDLVAAGIEIEGHEEPSVLESNNRLRELIEKIRLEAGPRMELGDVSAATVPKLTIVAPPRAGGHFDTRTFIPHRCHDAIGVLGALSVASAAILPGSPAQLVASRAGLAAPVPDSTLEIVVEHPTGTFEVTIGVGPSSPGDEGPDIERAGFIRTARKLMDGIAFPR